MRAAIYARYSSELQRAASIEDQVRLCKERVEREGWTLVATYTDHAMSGATALRPGYQELIEGARRGAFDVVVAEALDRMSRDQEHIAALYKRLSFEGIRLVTLAEGEITDLHVGLKGAMNSLFLKDLASKIRRGLRGRIEQKRSGGSKAYGYEVVREFDASGELIRGGRRINANEANIIRRVFREYAAGKSPRAIVKALNAEGIPGPSGENWSASTIYGNWQRGTGILNNELYIGRLVWNRQRFLKDPETGRRVGRVNPENEWIVKKVCELRIVEDDLWLNVKERQNRVRDALRRSDGSSSLNNAHRRRYLLSGLLKCGSCGYNYTIISSDRYGCASYRSRGTCSNDLAIKREEIEARVLGGLKEKLLAPELVQQFVAEFNAEVERASRATQVLRRQQQRQLEQVMHGIVNILSAIENGIYTSTTKDRLIELEERKAELEKEIAQPSIRPISIHPSVTELYRQKVAKLEEALNADDVRTEAAEALRGLIEEVRLTPDRKTGTLRVELHGELDAILALGEGQKRHRPACEKAGRFSMVAEEGLEPPTHGL